MKSSSRIIILIIFVFLFSFQSTIFAIGSASAEEPTVYDTLKKEEGNSIPASPNNVEGKSPTIFPMFMKFIFSFILVIGLLLLLLRFLSKRNGLVQSSGPVLPLGGHNLGNNKSVQVILIGETIYVVGVGENINLIRSIPKGEEYQHLLEIYENQSEGISSPKWLSGDTNKAWISVLQKHLQKMKKESRGE
jgi:flagellar protein FliO/FliZ